MDEALGDLRNAFTCDKDPDRQNTPGDAWITLALACIALPISLYFLVAAWKSWLTLHRPSLVAGERPGGSAPPTLQRSSSRRGVATPTQTASKDVTSPDSSRHRQRSLETIQSTSSAVSSMVGEPASDWTWKDTLKYWLKKLFHPRTVNQLISNLLLCSWVILTLDQFFHVLFVTSITFICPSYNCVNYITFATPACSAGPLEAVQLIIQPFGSCLFIVATVNRFVNVYSKLSRRRFIALRIGTAIAFFVCFGMSAVTALTYVITLSESSTAVQVAEAQRLLVLGDYVTYQTLGIVAVAALAMGLQYVYEIRKEVAALQPSIATPSIFNAVDTPNGTFSFLAVAASAPLDSPLTSSPTSGSIGGASVTGPGDVEMRPNVISKSMSSLVPYWMKPKPYPVVPSAPLSSIRSQTIMAPNKTIAKSPSTVALTLRRAYHSDRRKSFVTVVCILINITIIFVFMFQHSYIAPPPEGSKKGSTLFDLALMSLVHKVFAAFATVAIQLMTDLVLGNKKSSKGIGGR